MDRFISLFEGNKFYYGKDSIKELQDNLDKNPLLHAMTQAQLGIFDINLYLFDDKDGKRIYEDDFVKDKNNNIYYISSAKYNIDKDFKNRINMFLAKNNIKLFDFQGFDGCFLGCRKAKKNQKAKEIELKFLYSIWDKREITPMIIISAPKGLK